METELPNFDVRCLGKVYTCWVVAVNLKGYPVWIDELMFPEGALRVSHFSTTFLWPFSVFCQTLPSWDNASRLSVINGLVKSVSDIVFHLHSSYSSTLQTVCTLEPGDTLEKCMTFPRQHSMARLMRRRLKAGSNDCNAVFVLTICHYRSISWCVS